MLKICAVIPSRYNSKRLPGKPLLKINNKEILYLTYLRALKIFRDEDVYIFTESNIVKKIMKNRIKNIYIIKGNFLNGTERASAGMKFIKKKYDGIMIISCDNPYVPLKSINSTIDVFNKNFKFKDVVGSTVHTKSSSLKNFNDKSVAKIVLNKNNDIVYLSRSPIPALTKKYFYTHHGPVCIKKKYLKNYIKSQPSSFQKNEDNEWLGFIYNGYKIKSKLVNKIPREINTIEDLNYYRRKNAI